MKRQLVHVLSNCCVLVSALLYIRTTLTVQPKQLRLCSYGEKQGPARMCRQSLCTIITAEH